MGSVADGYGSSGGLDDTRRSSRVVRRSDANPLGVDPISHGRPLRNLTGPWSIGIAEAFLWGYNGWFHSDVGILTFSVVGLVGSLVMLARYHSTRGQVEVAV